MKIKLIQPAMILRPMDTKLKTRMSPSLALLSLAALTPPEHQIIIENENIEAINFDMPVDLVAITVTVDVMPRAVEIAAIYRARGIPVVAGGIHITAKPEACLGYFDAICIGMAERVWGRMIEDAENNQLAKTYSDMAGICGDEIVSPAYSMIDPEKYLYTNVISTSRGCPYQCDFCYNSCSNMQKVYLNRPIEKVIKDIKSLGTKHVMFIDDNFVGNPTWTHELLAAIKPLNLKWNAAVTANIIDRPELLDAMRDSGCQSLFIGFESINSQAIAGVHKVQNSVGRYEKLVEEIHRRGIMINASFVFGLDEDDASTFEKTLEWIVKNRIETVTSHILTPYPGTQLYASLAGQGRITDYNLAHYNTAHVVFAPQKMTADELFEGYIWIYKKIYSLGNIIRRMPQTRRQVVPYLAFNLIYRKFGKLSEVFCRLFSFNLLGRVSKRISYKVK